MPTSLTTERMSPALAERVRRSLKRRSGRARLAPGMLALLRVLTISTLIGCVVWLLSEQRARTDDFETAKAALLERQEAAQAKVQGKHELVAQLESWLVNSAGVYAGDVIDEDVRAPGALSAQLRRPAIYVRGPLTALGDHGAQGQSAAESTKDSLLDCLLSPPAQSDEKALFEAVQAAGAPLAASNAHVERLYAVLAAMPVLSDAWAERVRKADNIALIKRLDELFRLAPIEEAQRAANAELFVFALDEPKTDNSPSEFDGTTRHWVRVHVVDLTKSQLLLRVRQLVDPAWLSEARRHRYAGALTGCRLAVDVHAAVAAPRPRP